MKIFVINLKRSVKRRKNIERQLTQLGLKYELTEAIDGIEWGKERFRGLIEDGLIDRLPSGHLACGLSHHFLYKRIVDENLPQALILEDDIVLSDELPKIIKFFNENTLEGSQVVLLHMQIMFGATKLLTKHCTKLSSQSSLYYLQPEGTVGSTAAYIATKEFAQIKTERDSPISITVDGWREMMQRGMLDYLRCAYPYPVVPAMLPSDINYVNENTTKYKMKKYANSIPLISTLLIKYRKKQWKSKQVGIEFSDQPLLSANELFG